MKNLAFKLLDKTHKMINTKEFLKEHRVSDVYFTRSRKMNFVEIMNFCLNFVKKSLSLELDNYMELTDLNLEKPITKQAFSKARLHISPEAFKELFLMTSKIILDEKKIKKFKNYRIFAIDGTELILSNSKELHRVFSGRKTTAPRARTSIMCDVLNGGIIHSEISPLQIDERKLAIKHLEYFKEHSKCKDIVILDRGYPSKSMIEYFYKNKLNFLMRLQKSFNSKIDKNNNIDFDFSLEYDKVNYKIRVIKLLLDNGEIETLITNVSRNDFSQSEFKELYFLRWRIETKYDSIKNKLLIEDFTGKSEISVLQDFYATMYLSNIVSAIKNESDDKIIIETADKNLLHEYKTNENILIGKLRNKFILILLNEDPKVRELLLNKLISQISNHKIPIISDRKFKRVTERHKKTKVRRKRNL